MLPPLGLALGRMPWTLSPEFYRGIAWPVGHGLTRCFPAWRRRRHRGGEIRLNRAIAQAMESSTELGSRRWWTWDGETKSFGPTQKTPLTRVSSPHGPTSICYSK